MFRKKNARDDFKEVSWYRWVHLKTDPHNDSSEFLKYLKETVKQAFDSKANEFVHGFQFGNLSVAIQNEFPLSGKQDALVDEIRHLIERGYQHQQLLGTQPRQLFNEVFSGKKTQNDRPTGNNHAQWLKNIDTCFHCNKEGHKALNWRTRMQELAQKYPANMKSKEQWPQRTQAKPTQEGPNFNPKLIFQICGYTGHSALTSGHRIYTSA